MNKLKIFILLFAIVFFVTACSNNTPDSGGGDGGDGGDPAVPAGCPTVDDPGNYFQVIVDTQVEKSYQSVYGKYFGDFTPDCMDVHEDPEAGLNDSTPIEQLVPQANYENAVYCPFNGTCENKNGQIIVGDELEDLKNFYSYENFINAVKTVQEYGDTSSFLNFGSKEVKLKELAIIFSIIAQQTKPDQYLLTSKGAGSPTNHKEKAMRIAFSRKNSWLSDEKLNDGSAAMLSVGFMGHAAIENGNAAKVKIQVANMDLKGDFDGQKFDEANWNKMLNNESGYLSWVATLVTWMTALQPVEGSQKEFDSGHNIVTHQANFDVCLLGDPDSTVEDLLSRDIALAYAFSINFSNFNGRFFYFSGLVGSGTKPFADVMALMANSYKLYSKEFGANPKAYSGGYALSNSRLFKDPTTGFCTG